MKYLVLLRSCALLEQIRDDLDALFSRFLPGEPGEDHLLGIWVDPALATDPSPLLKEGEIIVAETIGLAGHWLACGFEPVGTDLSRHALMTILMSRTEESGIGRRQFIPVYPDSCDRDALLADLELLSSSAGRLLAEPWLQDSDGCLKRSSGRDRA
ncbi:hypothetical protein F6455_02925 [Proteobacteria bacterium 005FR1]|nr:hypothetical protein [Proteobacteria bacterium 005FR1]